LGNRGTWAQPNGAAETEPRFCRRTSCCRTSRFPCRDPHVVISRLSSSTLSLPALSLPKIAADPCHLASCHLAPHHLASWRVSLQEESPCQLRPVSVTDLPRLQTCLSYVPVSAMKTPCRESTRLPRTLGHPRTLGRHRTIGEVPEKARRPPGCSFGPDFPSTGPRPSAQTVLPASSSRPAPAAAARPDGPEANVVSPP
jgi:hypothetical protein